MPREECCTEHTLRSTALGGHYSLSFITSGYNCNTPKVMTWKKRLNLVWSLEVSSFHDNIAISLSHFISILPYKCFYGKGSKFLFLYLMLFPIFILINTVLNNILLSFPAKFSPLWWLKMKIGDFPAMPTMPNPSSLLPGYMLV